ncbi:unnamed protein product, partial [Owenia fusiformis]
MANVKKAFTGESKDLVDPYVLVSFAGQKGKTSVQKGCYEPLWNEQVVFTEMFPPLCRRFKIQLRDNDSVNDDVIGTHFIDINKVSNDGEKGFLPTFGPSWINLYGSIRDYSMLREHSHLNNGLGEGVSYRGRLLVSLKTELSDEESASSTQVEVEPALPIPENAAGRPEEYFLFTTILEATMIDKKVGEKPIHFELSIGNYGNTKDGQNVTIVETQESEDDESTSLVESAAQSTPEIPMWHSTSEPLKPITRDKFYYTVPYNAEKPCLYVKCWFEDHRRRMYNCNVLKRICDKLEDGMADVNEMINQERPFPERRLKGVLEELGSSCSKYCQLCRSSGGVNAGKTKLDKERSKMCQRDVEQLSTYARTLKATTNKHNLKERLKSTAVCLNKLKHLANEPQDALPDVFLWMLSNNKRVAYIRVPAKDIIHSIVGEECGKDCAKVQTLFLRLAGKKGEGAGGWNLQAKVQAYMWLGLTKHKKEFMKGLPTGYEETIDVKCAPRICSKPPTLLKYEEKQSFQLRCHMYQARNLIGSDASGLSDPFARVVFGDQSFCTQVIDETLSPTWDEMLIFNEVVHYGLMTEIKEDPPMIVIEIFDQDRVGKSEFIGRALAKPSVKMSHEKYNKPTFPPSLEWWDIYRGSEKAGELLAAFELLQLAPMSDRTGQDLPSVEMPTSDSKLDEDKGPVLPVPKGIRPVLSKHRIEVLFWGLRDLKRIQLTSVDRPRIDVECAGQVLQSSVIDNYKKNPNFLVPVKSFDVELPENEIFCPPITIRAVDCRNFGRYVLVGTHVITHIHKYRYIPTTKKAMSALSKLIPAIKKIDQKGNVDGSKDVKSKSPALSVKAQDVAINVDEKQPLLSKGEHIIKVEALTKEKKQDENMKKRRKSHGSIIDDDEPDEETMDWWSKYFASVEEMNMEEAGDKEDKKEQEGDDEDKMATNKNGNQQTTPYGTMPNGDTQGEDGDPGSKEMKKMEKELKKMEGGTPLKVSKIGKLKGAAVAVSLAAKLSPKTQRRKEKIDANCAKLKVYSNDLESQPEFNGFREWLHQFELYRGKKTGNLEDDESRVVGLFKGSLKVYKIPLPPDIEDTTITGGDPSYGLFQGLPNNDPISVKVRVYVLKCNDLHPADMNGKADPYIIIRLGRQSHSDKENYISKQLNPVFGKCFEFDATFPMDSLLTVQIYDWDLIKTDDLIGETKIDLESRYYSRHRATCGIASTYDTHGYNAWRDSMKPSLILLKLCKDGKVDGPHFQHNKVRVANRIFTCPSDVEDTDCEGKSHVEETLSLAVLKHWEEIPKVGCKLVPEHVETRPLFHPDKLGIEQGKVEMWVDMFPMDMPAPGPPVDVAPRKPKSYELRCIIWNTDDVVLEDDAFFTGEKMSDIYVK